MFTDVGHLQHTLLEKEPSEFVSHYLFESVPFIFGSDLSQWIHWKTLLAGKLDVDPRDVVLTGSAAIGFSLNPKKGFKSFDQDSDFDCGIISSYYFDAAWRHLRQIRPSWLLLSNAARRAIEDHRKNYVFAGTIATDRMLLELPFGRSWQDALIEMSSIEPSSNRTVKLRIYKDYDALRQYQAANIRMLRTTLFGDESSDEIGTEDA